MVPDGIFSSSFIAVELSLLALQASMQSCQLF